MARRLPRQLSALLPPEVLNTTTVLPVQSWESMNVLMICGASYHHTGKPR